MNAVKNSALLLALGAPFALYAVWQVHSATRADVTAAPPPADTGPTNEQLAASRTKAAAFAAASRNALDGSWQSAGPVPTSTDPAAAEALQAAAARAADLADLERFLSGAERPVFTGKLKPRYEEWTREQVAARRAEEAVRAWFRKPLAVASVADADRAMGEVNALIDEYAGLSRFANTGQTVRWRLQAQLQLVDLLTGLANTHYKAAVSAPLPLDQDTGAALAALRALRAHLAALQEGLRQADESKVPLAAEFRTTAEDKRARADEYAAREELLALFAKADLFADATGAERWLKSVAAQFAKTKDKEVQKIIRKKVQQFADSFIPASVRLDEDVVLRGRAAPRDKVVVSYDPALGEKTQTRSLSAEAGGFNEFSLSGKQPGLNYVVRYDGNSYELGDLKPTALSRAAVRYNEARARLADRPAPRWTAESIAELKKKCEEQKELVDQLRIPERKGAGAPPKIATRVSGLAAGAAACEDLFRPER
ncbi:MAG TPA: hypothetical protein VGE74_12975 [Gemmata sp.]